MSAYETFHCFATFVIKSSAPHCLIVTYCIGLKATEHEEGWENSRQLCKLGLA